MTRTILAILVAVGLLGAVAETAGARRSGGDMIASHGQCDCYDVALRVGAARVVGTSGGMFGAHTHIDMARDAIVGDAGGTLGLHIQVDGGSSPAG
jgi:hypothetical protein